MDHRIRRRLSMNTPAARLKLAKRLERDRIDLANHEPEVVTIQIGRIFEDGDLWEEGPLALLEPSSNTSTTPASSSVPVASTSAAAIAQASLTSSTSVHEPEVVPVASTSESAELVMNTTPTENRVILTAVRRSRGILRYRDPGSSVATNPEDVVVVGLDDSEPTPKRPKRGVSFTEEQTRVRYFYSPQLLLKKIRKNRRAQALRQREEELMLSAANRNGNVNGDESNLVVVNENHTTTNGISVLQNGDGDSDSSEDISEELNGHIEGPSASSTPKAKFNNINEIGQSAAPVISGLNSPSSSPSSSSPISIPSTSQSSPMPFSCNTLSIISTESSCSGPNSSSSSLSMDTNSNTQGQYEDSEIQQDPDDLEPLFPELAGCTDSIELILTNLTPDPFLHILRHDFSKYGIRTIGDLSTMTPQGISSFLMRTPRKDTAKNTLKEYFLMKAVVKPEESSFVKSESSFVKAEEPSAPGPVGALKPESPVTTPETQQDQLLMRKNPSNAETQQEELKIRKKKPKRRHARLTLRKGHRNRDRHRQRSKGHLVVPSPSPTIDIEKLKLKLKLSIPLERLTKFQIEKYTRGKKLESTAEQQQGERSTNMATIDSNDKSGAATASNQTVGSQKENNCEELALPSGVPNDLKSFSNGSIISRPRRSKRKRPEAQLEGVSGEGDNSKRLVETKLSNGFKVVKANESLAKSPLVLPVVSSTKRSRNSRSPVAGGSRSGQKTSLPSKQQQNGVSSTKVLPIEEIKVKDDVECAQRTEAKRKLRKSSIESELDQSTLPASSEASTVASSGSSISSSTSPLDKSSRRRRRRFRERRTNENYIRRKRKPKKLVDSGYPTSGVRPALLENLKQEEVAVVIIEDAQSGFEQQQQGQLVESLDQKQSQDTKVTTNVDTINETLEKSTDTAKTEDGAGESKVEVPEGKEVFKDEVAGGSSFKNSVAASERVVEIKGGNVSSMSETVFDRDGGPPSSPSVVNNNNYPEVVESCTSCNTGLGNSISIALTQKSLIKTKSRINRNPKTQTMYPPKRLLPVLLFSPSLEKISKTSASTETTSLSSPKISTKSSGSKGKLSFQHPRHLLSLIRYFLEDTEDVSNVIQSLFSVRSIGDKILMELVSHPDYSERYREAVKQLDKDNTETSVEEEELRDEVVKVEVTDEKGEGVVVGDVAESLSPSVEVKEEEGDIEVERKEQKEQVKKNDEEIQQKEEEEVSAEIRQEEVVQVRDVLTIREIKEEPPATTDKVEIEPVNSENVEVKVEDIVEVKVKEEKKEVEEQHMGSSSMVGVENVMLNAKEEVKESQLIQIADEIQRVGQLVRCRDLVPFDPNIFTNYHPSPQLETEFRGKLIDMARFCLTALGPFEANKLLQELYNEAGTINTNPPNSSTSMAMATTSSTTTNNNNLP